MIDIINEVKQKLIESGEENVYTIFDALPVSSKGRFFTVIGAKNFECTKPVFSEFTIFMPFKVNIEIKIIAPVNTSSDALFDYYNSNIRNTLEKISGLSSTISGMELKQDKNINRFVLTVNISAGGMKKIDRTE